MASSRETTRLVSFNRKGLLFLLAIGLVLTTVMASLYFSRQGRERRAVLAQAERLADAARTKRKDGTVQLNLAQFELAVRHLNRFLALHPSDPEVLKRQTEYTMELYNARGVVSPGEVLSAIRSHERLQALVGPDEAEPVQRRLADLYIRYSDAVSAGETAATDPEFATSELRYGAAEVLAEKLVEDDPKDVEARQLLAMALDGQGVPGDRESLEGAVKQYEIVLELDPGNIECALRLARIYRDRVPGTAEEREAKSKAVLTKLIEARPNDIGARMTRYYFFRESKWKEADQELQEALKIAPNSPMVCLAAAEQAARRGKLDEARDHLDAIEVEKEDPNSTEASFRVQVVQGLIEFADQRPQEALNQWRQGLLAFQGANAELNWWMAYVQFRLGQVGDADIYVKEYARLIGDKNDPGLRFLAVLELEQKGAWQEALLILDRIPTGTNGQLDEEIAMARGRCYEALGDRAKATVAYQQASRFSPNSAMPKLALASLQVSSNPEDAIRSLQGAFEQSNRQDPELLAALIQAHVLRLALLPRNARLFTVVDEFLDELARLDPESVSLKLLKADRLVLSDQADEALKLLEQAATEHPRDRRIWAAWSETLARQGEMTRALEVLDRAAQPDGAGDHASLRLIRARLLVGLARGREAQAALVGNMDNLPKDQRATLLEALGRLRATQGDMEGAREAFMAWAKLLPASKQPLLTLLQLSLEASDEAAAQGYLAEIEKLDRASVSSSVLGVQPQAGRADSLTLLARARVDYYFSDPGSAARGKQQDAQDAERLLRAEAAIKPLVDKKSPDPAVLLLYGQIQERKGNLDSAIESYRRAWELGNEASLPPLLNLLVRQERYEEIQSISKPESGLNVRRLSAQALLGFGNRQGNRGDLLDELKNDPARNEIWNTRMRELAGEFDEVENILRAQAREKTEPSLQIRRWLALIESQARHNRSAQVIEESIRELLKTKTRLPDLLEAQARWSAGQLGEAEKIYGEVVRQRADDPVALAAVAQHYEATGRPDQAIATYNQAYQLNTANRPVARQLAIAVSAQVGSNLELWEKAWELVRPDEGSSAEDRLARAVVLARHPDPSRREEVVPLLIELLSDLDPAQATAASARDYLARYLIATGRAEQAIPYAAITAQSGVIPAMMLHAEALIEAGQLPAAEVVLDRMVLVDPVAPAEARLRTKLVAARAGGEAAPAKLAEEVISRRDGPAAVALGRVSFQEILSKLGDPPVVASLEAAEKIAQDLSKSDPGLSWMMAQVQILRGQPEAAFSYCLTAAEAPEATESDRTEASRTALAAAARSNKMSEAGAVLDAALRYAPNSPELLSLRAVVYHSMGDFEAEVRLYRKVLDLVPEGLPQTDDIVNNLVWAISEGLDRPREALPLIEGLIQRRGPKPQWLCTRGVVLTRLGQHEQAIADLRQAVQGDSNGRRLFLLARAYRAAGEMDQAKAVFGQARQAGLNETEMDLTEQADFQALLQL